MQELPQDPGECQCGCCQAARDEAVANREAKTAPMRLRPEGLLPPHRAGELQFWEAVMVACVEGLVGLDVAERIADEAVRLRRKRLS